MNLVFIQHQMFTQTKFLIGLNVLSEHSGLRLDILET